MTMFILGAIVGGCLAIIIFGMLAISAGSTAWDEGYKVGLKRGRNGPEAEEEEEEESE